mmetsp:Transcript_35459/g.110593  ORF Transcript_35459/g.110593 Transcript_35459/m.110593 type:complete len:417 (+) Transcript_35459:519-1769(+)
MSARRRRPACLRAASRCSASTSQTSPARPTSPRSGPRSSGPAWRGWPRGPGSAPWSARPWASARATTRWSGCGPSWRPAAAARWTPSPSTRTPAMGGGCGSTSTGSASSASPSGSRRWPARTRSPPSDCPWPARWRTCARQSRCSSTTPTSTCMRGSATSRTSGPSPSPWGLTATRAWSAPTDPSPRWAGSTPLSRRPSQGSRRPPRVAARCRRRRRRRGPRGRRRRWTLAGLARDHVWRRGALCVLRGVQRLLAGPPALPRALPTGGLRRLLPLRGQGRLLAVRAGGACRSRGGQGARPASLPRGSDARQVCWAPRSPGERAPDVQTALVALHRDAEDVAAGGPEALPRPQNRAVRAAAGGPQAAAGGGAGLPLRRQLLARGPRVRGAHGLRALLHGPVRLVLGRQEALPRRRAD